MAGGARCRPVGCGASCRSGAGAPGLRRRRVQRPASGGERQPRLQPQHTRPGAAVRLPDTAVRRGACSGPREVLQAGDSRAGRQGGAHAASAAGRRHRARPLGRAARHREDGRRCCVRGRLGDCRGPRIAPRADSRPGPRGCPRHPRHQPGRARSQWEDARAERPGRGASLQADRAAPKDRASRENLADGDAGVRRRPQRCLPEAGHARDAVHAARRRRRRGTARRALRGERRFRAAACDVPRCAERQVRRGPRTCDLRRPPRSERRRVTGDRRGQVPVSPAAAVGTRQRHHRRRELRACYGRAGDAVSREPAGVERAPHRRQALEERPPGPRRRARRWATSSRSSSWRWTCTGVATTSAGRCCPVCPWCSSAEARTTPGPPPRRRPTTSTSSRSRSAATTIATISTRASAARCPRSTPARSAPAALPISA